ncbi:MAG: hypothetical protein JWN56_846 [Sphingobacteriales bacterium]|nr:hypothetical protein [Sphingobacteriales bacterium]
MTISSYSVLFLCFIAANCSACQNKKNKTGNSKNHPNELSNNAKVPSEGKNEKFSIVAEMPKKLKEISGIVKDGDFLWAISDDQKADIFKLDLSGNIVQKLHLSNLTVTDVEDVTTDSDYLYIADVGDNDGTRQERQIIKIKKSEIPTAAESDVTGQAIRFTFPAQSGVQTKKTNENDCESILIYKESLYLFTKRRDDKQTELFKLTKKAGNQIPRAISLFNSKGLITGAALNAQGTEVSLVGYHGGHKQPFIWKLSSFMGDDFFSGKQQEYVLNEDQKDWQVEAVTYKDDGTLLFACEKTPDFAAAIYTTAMAK